jgi:hypothetical protein
MMMAGVATAFGAPALAQRQERPPEGSLPASEIVRRVEQRGDFGWLKEIEWDEDGYWDVEYWTRDGRLREIDVDPGTGRERR